MKNQFETSRGYISAYEDVYDYLKVKHDTSASYQTNENIDNTAFWHGYQCAIDEVLEAIHSTYMTEQGSAK